MKKILRKKLYRLQFISSNFISFFSFILIFFLFHFHFFNNLVISSFVSNFNFIYIFHFPKGCSFNGIDKWRLDDKSLLVQLVLDIFKISKIQTPSPK